MNDDENKKAYSAVATVLVEAIKLVDDTPSYADEAEAVKGLAEAVAALRETGWLRRAPG